MSYSTHRYTAQKGRSPSTVTPSTTRKAPIVDLSCLADGGGKPVARSGAGKACIDLTGEALPPSVVFASGGRGARQAAVELDKTSSYIVDQVRKLEPLEGMVNTRLAWILSFSEATVERIPASHELPGWKLADMMHMRPNGNQIQSVRRALQASDSMGAAAALRGHEAFSGVPDSIIRFWTWQLSHGLEIRTPLAVPDVPVRRGSTGRKDRVNYTPAEDAVIQRVAAMLRPSTHTEIAKYLVANECLPGRSPDQIKYLCYNRFKRSAQPPGPDVARPRVARNVSQAHQADGELRRRLSSFSANELVHRFAKTYLHLSGDDVMNLARLKPRSRAEFLLVPNFGSAKYNLYGEQIMELIRGHCERRGI